MLRRLITALMLAVVAVAHADGDPLAEALTAAKAKGQPVLLDFHAPWCYSCYFMQKTVLNGPEWLKVERAVVVLDLDADSPEGAAIKDKYGVKALPNYVVINANGDELGRINAERTRVQFYPELTAILQRNTRLDDLRAAASKGQLAAVASVLATYLARDEGQLGLDWFAALPAAVQLAATKNVQIPRRLARLQLKAASSAQQPQACIAAATTALAGKLDCESAYDLDSLLSCTAEAKDARKPLLAAQTPRFAVLLKQTLAARPACADARTIIFANADLAEARGDAAGKAAVLQRGIAVFEPKVLKNIKADRNADDNLRVLYEAAGEADKLDALLQKLIAAYPDDYVYANRYARALAARGEHEKALPWFAQAALQAYGVNRLKNAQTRVQSLLALQRGNEARSVAAEALKANGPWFPAEASKLKSLLPAA